MSQENLSLLKALDVLDLFSKDNVEYRLSEIANLLNMPVSTTHRILRTLEKRDYIRQNPSNGKYLLGVSAFVLGSNVVSINVMVDAALPRIAELASKYQATSHVATLRNGRLLCVERVESPFAKIDTPARGEQHELQVTSLGKCLLAFSSPQVLEGLLKSITYRAITPNSITDEEELLEELQRVRKQGYALDRSESSKGLFCFGSPIFAKDGSLLAAISVALHASSMPDNAASIITDVKQAADEISKHVALTS
ncbi:MAG: IclR family transcriptional regulator [Christensenellales bacterium]|jgi:IclR family KDG regulon transcriptional repressor